MDLVARWPGSAHDATIFANSRIRARFEGGEFPNTHLLGEVLYNVGFALSQMFLCSKKYFIFFFAGDSGYMLLIY